MNIWDSVHRGLEKASNEAGRIAKTQRLRSAIDKMGRQVQERETALFNSVMHLYSIGALNQPELLSLCQEIAQIHQQLLQLQSELQQLHTQPATEPAAPPQAASTAVNPYIFPASGAPYTDIASELPPDHPYAQTATPIPTPPPPPGVADYSAQPFDSNAHQTQPIPSSGTKPPGAGTINCPQCGMATLSSGTFCQNCGAPLEHLEPRQLTIQAQSQPGSSQSTNETVYTGLEQQATPAPLLETGEQEGASGAALPQAEAARTNDTPPPAN